MTDGYDAFELYIAVKLSYDLSSSYDYWRYAGKTNVKKSTFTKRKDKHHFYVLAKRMGFDRDAIRNYLFVNMLYQPDAWVGNLLNDECSSRYKQFEKYRNSFKYAFTDEVKKLKSVCDDHQYTFNELLSAKDTIPKLMEMYYAGNVTPYAVHGFHRVFHILNTWESRSEVFEPLLTSPLKRLQIAQNFIFPLTNHLTTSDFSGILKATFIED